MYHYDAKDSNAEERAAAPACFYGVLRRWTIVLIYSFMSLAISSTCSTQCRASQLVSPLTAKPSINRRT